MSSSDRACHFLADQCCFYHVSHTMTVQAPPESILLVSDAKENKQTQLAK